MLTQQWRIELLNRFALCHGSTTIARFRTQKTAELLAYLALNRYRTVYREELADTIWPESDAVAGRTSLRTALTSLRHQLEPPGIPFKCVLYTDRTTVRLQPNAVTTDVEAFDAACRVGAEAPADERLQAGIDALNLYAGELLPGWYSDWVFPERERLAEAHVRLLRVVISGLWKRGDNEIAIDYARRLVAADPLQDEANILARKLYASAGRSTDALRHFQNYERNLREELGDSPSPEAWSQVTQFAEASGKTIDSRRPIGRKRGVSPRTGVSLPSSVAPARPQLPDAPVHAVLSSQSVRLPLVLNRFFGRDTEIMEIERMLQPEAARYSAGGAAERIRLLTLTGPGGTGKTRLAVEVARRLATHAFQSVTFVPLSEVHEPHRIPDTIASTFMIPANGHADRIEALAAVLGANRHLVVLDNLEQLLSPVMQAPEPLTESNADAADIIAQLLARIPSLALLVTS